jgi:hypothetical protein
MPATVVFDAPRNEALNLNDLYLSVGVHPTPAHGVCVMEAASVVAGEPWTDRPQCTSPAISRFLRRWNDTLPYRPRQALKRYICPVVGTRTTAADELERLALVTDWLVRVYTPAWLGLAGLAAAAATLAEHSPIRSVVLPDDVRSTLVAARHSASQRTTPSQLNLPLVRRVARESGWDAATATLVPQPQAPQAAAAIADHMLVLDLALTSLAAASSAQVGPTATRLRLTTHDMVQSMCTVGQESRQRWSA